MTIYAVTLLIVRLFNQAVLTAGVTRKWHRILNVTLSDFGIVAVVHMGSITRRLCCALYIA